MCVNMELSRSYHDLILWQKSMNVGATLLVALTRAGSSPTPTTDKSVCPYHPCMIEIPLHQDIQYYIRLSQRIDLCFSDEKGWDFNTCKYRGRSGKEQRRSIPPVSRNSTRFVREIRNLSVDLSEFWIHYNTTQECRRIGGQLQRDSKIIGSFKEITNELNHP